MPEFVPSASGGHASARAARRLAAVFACCAVGLLAGASNRPVTPAPVAVEAVDSTLAVPAAPTGLAAPGWRVEPPAERPIALARLRAREARAVTPLGAWRSGGPALAVDGTAGASTDPGQDGADAALVAVEFALAQAGKPYLWGAAGPEAYDCSGLVQRAYADAGIGLPRVAADQALVGVPVRLADLLPGDLLFWAYDVASPATVHHVAMYVGDGYVVHAPQTGDVVRVVPVWLVGYAGAVRVAALPRTAAAPTGGAAGPWPLPTPPPATPAGPSRSPAPSRPAPPLSTSPAAPAPRPTTTSPPAGGGPPSTTPAPTSPTDPTPAPTPTETTPAPSPTDPPPTDPSPSPSADPSVSVSASASASVSASDTASAPDTASASAALSSP